MSVRLYAGHTSANTFYQLGEYNLLTSDHYLVTLLLSSRIHCSNCQLSQLTQGR